MIGIYRALVKIGAAGQASIDAVAGPVGEALIMTAVGLVVAVPAVMGYNWLIRRNKLVAEQIGTFSNDLHGYMVSNGAVRPALVAGEDRAGSGCQTRHRHQGRNWACGRPSGRPLALHGREALDRISLVWR